MSNPVEASQGAPLYGGLSGYLRKTPGKPTSVPGSAPAFRGVNNIPGQSVKSPAIRTSYNRNDRGTNVVIPYARVVPLEHLRDVGRVSPGDVVFAARTKLTPYGYGINTQMRLVGIDWINRQLGGRPEYDKSMPDGTSKHTHLWQVGYNVLLGTASGQASSLQPGGVKLLAGNAIADEWRSLTVLQEWTCDGIVLSNDQPNAHNSSGDRDGQLFNIAIQGVCAVNNGYVDFSGKGVELNHRGTGTDKNGYYDGGEAPESRDFATAFGGPYYNSYPLQMFDRKLRPMTDVYVGLVATRRRMDANTQYKEQLQANCTGSGIVQQKQDIEDAVYFYTFHYAYFSSNQAYGYEFADYKDAWDVAPVDDANNRLMDSDGNPIKNPYQDNPSLSESATKRSRRHYEDAKAGQEYDPYRGMSDREWHGLVGAWKIGKVLDIAATKKDSYYGGPVDTSDRITVNVDLEFKDWRQLRREFDNGRIGRDIPGAIEWGGGPGSGGAGGVEHLPVGAFEEDEGFVLKWPTAYVKPSGGADPKSVQDANRPIDPMTIDEAVRGSNKKRKAVGDNAKGAGSFSMHGLGREATSTVSWSTGRPVLPEEKHEFSLLRPDATQKIAYARAIAPIVGPDRIVPGTVNPTMTIPTPSIYALKSSEPGTPATTEEVRGSAAGRSGVSGATVAPAATNKGKAPVGAAAGKQKKGVTPPKQRPAAAIPSPSPGSVAAVVTASAGAAISAAASPSVANTGAVVAPTESAVGAVPPQQRPGVRRGRAGEQGTADVFASIFGGDAAPAATSSSAAEPSVQPSPSEGSDDGKQRGRVRRARDGR